MQTYNDIDLCKPGNRVLCATGCFYTVEYIRDFLYKKLNDGHILRMFSDYLYTRYSVYALGPYEKLCQSKVRDVIKGDVLMVMNIDEGHSRYIDVRVLKVANTRDWKRVLSSHERAEFAYYLDRFNLRYKGFNVTDEGYMAYKTIVFRELKPDVTVTDDLLSKIRSRFVKGEGSKVLSQYTMSLKPYFE